MHSRKFAVCIAMSLLLLPACAGKGGGSASPAANQTLYDQLGGEKAIALVVDDFVQRVLANENVNFTRKGTSAPWEPTPANLARLKAGLVAFITELADGPDRYTGKPMKAAHAGMKITDDEFFAAAADLEASLIRFNVAQVQRAELLQRVAATRGDIVSK